MRNNYIGPKKLEKLQASQEEYRNKIKTLHEHGFEVFAIHYRGKNPISWSFSYNGKKSAYGWDHESQVIQHLISSHNISII